MSEEIEQEEGVSRRGFMKMLGIGSLSIGALSLIPSAASRVRIGSDSIDVNGNNFLSGMPGTEVAGEIKNFVLDKRTADPSNPEVGQMWYRTDLD
ncbi:twin-arginine translocation signal domain-containing protein [Candidatus Nanosalina sp. VS9-1]|uniref:twin-arginine translocation signal domain-containing protein n=1 Tax=Candidatus Nanosalina sp. VS9-1 TaxID=3388566 RepID=UPI0039E02FC8